MTIFGRGSGECELTETKQNGKYTLSLAVFILLDVIQIKDSMSTSSWNGKYR